MVNYKWNLPGPVRQRKLADTIRNDGLLVDFDPTRHAAVQVKLPYKDADRTLLASLFIFAKKTIIISTPRCVHRDKLLTHIFNFIEERVLSRWQALRMASQVRP